MTPEIRMKIVIPAVFLALMLSGCASTIYGHKPEVWNNMSQSERDEAIMRAERMVERSQQKQREDEFVYQPINAVFGSRSNVYGGKQLIY